MLWIRIRTGIENTDSDPHMTKYYKIEAKGVGFKTKIHISETQLSKKLKVLLMPLFS